MRARARSASATASTIRRVMLRPVSADAVITRGRSRSFVRDPRLGVLEVRVGHVPLVQHDDRGAAVAHREVGDAQVLGR